MIKKFFARSISRPGLLSAIFIVPILLSVLAAGCGESPGGSQFGGGVSGDTTAPVTKVNKNTGNYDAETVITYTCTDNSSGCDKTYLKMNLLDLPESDDDYMDYVEYWDWNVSGAGGNSFTIQLCGASFSGKTYDYSFYSTDEADNQESAHSKLYTVK